MPSLTSYMPQPPLKPKMPSSTRAMNNPKTSAIQMHQHHRERCAQTIVEKSPEIKGTKSKSRTRERRSSAYSGRQSPALMINLNEVQQNKKSSLGRLSAFRGDASPYYPVSSSYRRKTSRNRDSLLETDLAVITNMDIGDLPVPMLDRPK